MKEKNLRKMIDELQNQVERERNEKRDALTQADESCQKLIEKQSELGTVHEYDHYESFSILNLLFIIILFCDASFHDYCFLSCNHQRDFKVDLMTVIYTLRLCCRKR